MNEKFTAFKLLGGTPGSRAFRVESSISHSMREMGPEGQGQQIKVSDQRWLLQGEGTQGGYLEASEASDGNIIVMNK